MRAILIAFALCSVSLLISGGESQAQGTCSDRHADCRVICPNYAARRECPQLCADTFARCVRTGCWISQIENKCGYRRR